jgi:hypothetical protein
MAIAALIRRAASPVRLQTHLASTSLHTTVLWRRMTQTCRCGDIACPLAKDPLVRARMLATKA